MRKFVICICLILVSCSASTQRRYNPDEDIDGEPGGSYASELSLTAKGPEAELRRAGQFARDRNFTGAMELYRRVYSDRANDPEIRAEALLGLAETQGALFNAQKNYDAAIATLGRFLEEFPESEFRPSAEDALARFRAIKERQ